MVWLDTPGSPWMPSPRSIKPGITGMAQVSGRADLDFEEEIKLDTFYIENWSPWLDIAILIRTAISARSYRNAY